MTNITAVCNVTIGLGSRILGELMALHKLRNSTWPSQILQLFERFVHTTDWSWSPASLWIYGSETLDSLSTCTTPRLHSLVHRPHRYVFARARLRVSSSKPDYGCFGFSLPRPEIHASTSTVTVEHAQVNHTTSYATGGRTNSDLVKTFILGPFNV